MDNILTLKIHDRAVCGAEYWAQPDPSRGDKSHCRRGATPDRAWREHLNLTRDEVAKRMGISQPAFAQQDTATKPRKASREKIAAVLGINANQLGL